MPTGEAAEAQLRTAGLPHTAGAYAQAWTIGGILCLVWGFALPAMIWWPGWNLLSGGAIAAVLAAGTSLVVLAQFLRRRRVWAAHGLWAIALAGLLSLTLFVFVWRRKPGAAGLILFAIAAANLFQLGWHAWFAARELERAAHGGERGFEALAPGSSVILPALPADPPAPGDTPAAGQLPPSDSSREK